MIVIKTLSAVGGKREMYECITKYGLIKMYAKTAEEEAIKQIIEMANSPLGENANLRIMPDCHSGKGCVIGTTMKITDKVCPNLVGVDIGCGVDLIKTDICFNDRLQEIDNIVREYVPFGMNTHKSIKEWNFQRLRCWKNLDKRTKDLAYTALGSLGGGNHFIEAYNDGYLSVHSGSRNIGYKVAEYYQNLAEKEIMSKKKNIIEIELKNIETQKRQEWLKSNNLSNFNKDFCYLQGKNMEDYLYDIKIMQEFAQDNRMTILRTIIKEMGGTILDHISSIHNYIDIDTMILRKGAISAKKNEKLVIPLNMKDGLLICVGKGNEDWNFSAPHGAGRLYSRAKAKETFTLEQYQNEMKGIFSTCINENTLDEAPFAYKNYTEILECIQPTVEIENRLIPIFNFKAN